jgi:putative FmdB family regulatory protein
MPRYDFTCTKCGAEQEVILSLSEFESEMLLHCCGDGNPDTGFDTLHRHVIGKVSIGVVNGAGGSPAR